MPEAHCVSHPFLGLPSQLAHPAAHEGVHPPAVHVVVPCAFVHVMLQPPQWLVLV
jgi:hypothetical protein